MSTKTQELEKFVLETKEAIVVRATLDFERVRVVTSLFHQGVVGGLLTLHLGATAVLSGVVFSESFPYPYMFVFMGLLLWVVFAMRFMALKGLRFAAATRSLVVNLLLTAFWVFVLIDQIPPRPVVDGVIRPRPEMSLVWIAIGMYVLAQVGMVVQGIIDKVRRRRLKF
jgi:hypothetical protein